MFLKFSLSNAAEFCSIGMSGAAPVLKVSADRGDALYAVGETFRFLISLSDDGRPLAGRRIHCDFVGEESARGQLEVTTDAPAGRK